MNYNSIKQLSKERKCSVKDLLALSQVNDPFYIAPSDKKKAEWVAMIWHKEKSKPIHQRGFHYRIVDKNYKLPDGSVYLNTEKCWIYLQLGFKYARFLGLIGYDEILDHKNPDEEETGNFAEHEGITYNSYNNTLNNRLNEEDNPDEFIDRLISDISENFNVDYNSNKFQPFYIEIWAEKSGIIPRVVAMRFGATMRPAGGGEFSLDMCHKALQRAEELGKPLLIFLLTDFDPKGNDMPKSVSRKIEFMATHFSINAYVKQIALTKKQCEKYNLPSIPAKNPDGDGSGSKAYRSHTKKFYNAMGRQTTEINSLMARDEKNYEKEIREEIEPFFDYNMGSEVMELEREIKDQIEECVRAEIEPNKKDIIDTSLKLTKAEEELDEFIEWKKEELGIEKLKEKFNNLTEINPDQIMNGLLFELPVSEVEPPTDAILDTTREYLEQLNVYKNSDIRTLKGIANSLSSLDDIQEAPKNG